MSYLMEEEEKSSRQKESITKSSSNKNQKLKTLIKKIIVKAKRFKIWYTLNKIEKGILELTTKLDIKLTSIKLLRAIVKITKEIEEKISFTYQNYILGLKTAYNVVKFIVEKGYREAKDWIKDKNFIIWWGIFLNPKTYTK